MNQVATVSTPTSTTSFSSSAVALPNSRPPVWPPPLDWPVVVDGNGVVVSRVYDPVWKLWPWFGKRTQLNFGLGATTGRKINPENARIFQIVMSWFVWHARGHVSAAKILSRFNVLKPLFSACSDANISACELSRYPKVIENVAKSIAKTSRTHAVMILNDLLNDQEGLGFVLMDSAALTELAKLIEPRDSVQTPYIPPRIWSYQLNRLRACLEDFEAHSEKVAACYDFCLEAYARNEVSHGGERNWGDHRHPFRTSNIPENPRDGRRYYGPFHLTAEKFGIQDLLARWVNVSHRNGLKSLTSYLSLVTSVGMAYLLNFSLMRRDEVAQLRSDCLRIERDEVGEDIYLLGGVTSKTVEDDEARWIIAPAGALAVRAMREVSALRTKAAASVHGVVLDPSQLKNPLLLGWAHEPWAAAPKERVTRRVPPAYSVVIATLPKLFDIEQLRITADDLAIAKKMTFGLDPLEFEVGKTWPLAWHQLRRTGAVNMRASGLVSDASLQYQLKHATRAMTRYYGNNHYRLKSSLNSEARGIYVREMYASVARDFEALHDKRFASPYGDKRKAQILTPVSEKDHKVLLTEAKAGRINYRETLFGVCTRTCEICPVGGVLNVVGCMGAGNEKACADVLIDRDKRPGIVKLKELLKARIDAVEPASPLHSSLQAQLQSTQRAIYVIDNS